MPPKKANRPAQCHFYIKGTCRKGSACVFRHDALADTTTSTAPSSSKDSRNNVPCRYYQLGSCLKGDDCPFSHADSAQGEDAAGGTATTGKRQSALAAAGAADADEADDPENSQESQSWHREIGGAVVEFGDGAAVAKVSFASDFSAVRLRQVPVDETASSLAETLVYLGEPVAADNVRIIAPSDDAQGPDSMQQADIRVEDAHFAERVCALPLMKQYAPTAVATTSIAAQQLARIKATSFQRVDSKKVHVSWHKATKLVWLNFGSEQLASKVSSGFQRGIYTVDGHRVEANLSYSTTGDDIDDDDFAYLRGGRRGRFRRPQNNRQAWTVALSDVPAQASQAAVTCSIPQGLVPRHVEMGQSSAAASSSRDINVDAATATAMIQSHLGQAGPLEWWEESTGALTAGKRHKAKARFVNETDAARAVEMFNGKPLPFNSRSLLTVQLVHAARIKVSAAIYTAAADAILSHVQSWKKKYVQYTAYPAAMGFRVLKLEGSGRQDVAAAKSELEAVLGGAVVMQQPGGTTPLWTPAFARSGTGGGRKVQAELKRLEIQYTVVILRDTRKSQVRVVGTAPRQDKAAAALNLLLRAGTLPTAAATEKTFAILLDAAEFLWAFRGGYRIVQEAVGAGNVRLDAVSTPRRAIFSDEASCRKALGIFRARPASSAQVQPATAVEAVCSVCWTEPEDAVTTPCQHRYCRSCFEDMCHAGIDDIDKGIRCMGDAATCNIQLPLGVLQKNLSSAALEDVLEDAFKAHVARNVQELRHCPTADCSQVYRVSKLPASAVGAAALFTCPSCMAPVCRSCHVVHEGMSCADYRDQATGGYRALSRAKAKLGIKDCPKCGTLIDKYEGCNHVTCPGCRSHICWVCLQLFSAGVIYQHMQDKHGGFVDING